MENLGFPDTSPLIYGPFQAVNKVVVSSEIVIHATMWMNLKVCKLSHKKTNVGFHLRELPQVV